MKKQRKKKGTGAKRATGPVATSEAVKDAGKRKSLTLLRNGTIGLVLAGGLGAYAYSSVMTSRAEHDLSRVGQGTPSVVQIHDPTCSLCTSLQKEVRQALGDLEDGTVTYLVANIKTPEGRRFASRYGVPHVTLLLFDGKGRLKQTLRGVRDSEELAVTFQVLAELEG